MSLGQPLSPGFQISCKTIYQYLLYPKNPEESLLWLVRYSPDKFQWFWARPWASLRVQYFFILKPSCTTSRIKQRTELWVPNDILKSIKERDKAFRFFKKFKTEETFFIFKELRNKTQNLILNAKRNYFKDKLESEKNSKS